MASSNASRFSRPRGFLCGCPEAVGARDPAPCKPHVEKPEWRTYANSSSLRGAKALPLHSAHGTGCPWNTSPKASRPAHPACTFYASLLADEKRERNCVALEAVSSRPEIQCRGKARRLLFRPGRDLQIRARVRDVLHQFLGARRQPPSSSRRKASSAGMVCNSLR
jgi:hypothetical protein